MCLIGCTSSVLRWPYKITYYIGYGKLNEMGIDEYIEVYNVQLDPEELYNLADVDRALTQGLRDEVVAYQ